MPPLLLRAERPDRLAAQRRRSRQADGERALPRGGPRVEVAVGIGALVDAGVVDEHVHAPAPRERLAHSGAAARGSARSAVTACARSPSSSASAPRRPSARRSCTTTCRREPAIVRAVAAPIPPAAPVISTTRSVRSIMAAACHAQPPQAERLDSMVQGHFTAPAKRLRAEHRRLATERRPHGQFRP